MANRHFSQFRYSLEKNVVDLYLKVTIGATGAPTLARAKGVTSIVRNSAGNYTVTLMDTYNALLGIDSAFIHAATGIPATSNVTVVSETVATTKTIIFVTSFATAAGNTALVATDPANGETLLLHVALSNSAAI